MYQVNLKNNKSFTCASNETILDAALRNKVSLNYSCKIGNCFSCKYKILDGFTICESEEIALTEEEKRQGFVLLCQRKASSDITIEGEDLSEYDIPKASTLPAKINEIIFLTEDIISVSLRIPPSADVRFLPGQYLDIIHGDIRRSYSIASSIDHRIILLLIRKYAHGAMSEYWFNKARVNDLLRIEIPKGTFFLRKTCSIETIIFLATGTGIAPIKSIIESYGVALSSSYRRVIVLWGMRYENEIFWKPEFDSIEFIPVLSRSFGGSNKKTYVQDFLAMLKVEWQKVAIYACGSLGMINSSFKMSMDLGVKPENFFSDAFVKSN